MELMRLFLFTQLYGLNQNLYQEGTRDLLALPLMAKSISRGHARSPCATPYGKIYIKRAREISLRYPLWQNLHRDGTCSMSIVFLILACFLLNLISNLKKRLYKDIT